MELDELKNLVRAGEFKAITLDTSIFDAQGLRLESGLLKQLEQFQDSSTRLILSEVVQEETLSHLMEKARNAQKGIEKSLRLAREHWCIEDQDIEEIKEIVFGGRKAQEIVFERFNQSKIIVVTSDNDWKSFCKGSERLIAIDDFAGALGLFQLQDADDICKYLSEKY